MISEESNLTFYNAIILSACLPFIVFLNVTLIQGVSLRLNIIFKLNIIYSLQ